MIIRRIVEKINVVRPAGNPARITMRQTSVVVAKRFGVVNIVQAGDGGTATVVAAENVGGHRVITMSGNYASKDNPNDKFNILGVTQGAAVMGASATAKTFGEMVESSWNWTAGMPVFLSTNGQLTQTAPASGFRIIIGRAKNSTTLFVDISEPIVIT